METRRMKPDALAGQLVAAVLEPHPRQERAVQQPVRKGTMVAAPMGAILIGAAVAVALALLGRTQQAPLPVMAGTEQRRL